MDRSVQFTLRGGKEVLCKNGFSFSQCFSRSPRCARHWAPVGKSPFPLLSLTFLPSKTPLSRCPCATLVRFSLTCSGFSATLRYLLPSIEPLKGPPHCQHVTLVRFLLTCSGFSTTPPYLSPPIEPLKGPSHCQLSSGT